LVLVRLFTPFYITANDIQIILESWKSILPWNSGKGGVYKAMRVVLQYFPLQEDYLGDGIPS
jgi:hypothetical protein